MMRPEDQASFGPPTSRIYSELACWNLTATAALNSVTASYRVHMLRGLTLYFELHYGAL